MSLALCELIPNSEAHWGFEVNTVFRLIYGIWELKYKLGIGAAESHTFSLFQTGGLAGPFAYLFSPHCFSSVRAGQRAG